MQKQMRMQHGAEPVYVAQVQEKEVDFRTHMQKIKSAGVDGIMVAALAETMAEPWSSLMRQASDLMFDASVHLQPQRARTEIAGDAVKGVFYAAAYSDADTRPVARLFNEMVRKRYGIHAPDHDFSQAYDLIRIVEIALNNAKVSLTSSSLKADRAAIRDAIAGIRITRVWPPVRSVSVLIPHQSAGRKQDSCPDCLHQGWRAI